MTQAHPARSGPPRRVLIFLPCLTRGGAERQGFLVARYLQERGHDVEVWGFPAPDGRAPLVEDLRRHGIVHEQLPAWPSLAWSAARYGPLAALVRSVRWSRGRRRLEAELPTRLFDVIVPFTFWPCLAARVMQAKLGAARCVWNHRGGYDAAGIDYDEFVKAEILREPPLFVANSHAGARFLRDTFGPAAGGVTVIPNAFVPEESGPVPSALKESPELTLLHVANFYPEKDYETLLEAMRLLQAAGVACRLHFCGQFLSAGDGQQFARRVRAQGVQDRIVHHGPATRASVQALLGAADIGLLSSRSEGQPNAIMEYMHAGLPVIATRIPGIEELLGEAAAPWLFEIGDAGGLATLIQRLSEAPALRKTLGAHNRHRLLQNHTPEATLPEWEKLLGDVPQTGVLGTAYK